VGGREIGDLLDWRAIAARVDRGLIRLVINDEHGKPHRSTTVHPGHESTQDRRVLLHDTQNSLVALQHVPAHGPGPEVAVEIGRRELDPAHAVLGLADTVSGNAELTVETALGLLSQPVMYPGEHDHELVPEVSRLRDERGEVCGLAALHIAHHKAQHTK